MYPAYTHFIQQSDLIAILLFYWLYADSIIAFHLLLLCCFMLFLMTYSILYLICYIFCIISSFSRILFLHFDIFLFYHFIFHCLPVCFTCNFRAYSSFYDFYLSMICTRSAIFTVYRWNTDEEGERQKHFHECPIASLTWKLFSGIATKGYITLIFTLPDGMKWSITNQILYPPLSNPHMTSNIHLCETCIEFYSILLQIWLLISFIDNPNMNKLVVIHYEIFDRLCKYPLLISSHFLFQYLQSMEVYIFDSTIVSKISAVELLLSLMKQKSLTQRFFFHRLPSTNSSYNLMYPSSEWSDFL